MERPEPVVLDKATSWKGHPQPPVNKRLRQAKIFLADEDVNRCLNFTERLSEIEEWLNYVEEEQLECDPLLLRDVQTMAAVQRDWLSRMDAPPIETSLSDPLGVPNFSTRLVDTDTAKKLDEERERMGLRTEMREDHAPFTVDRSADQVDFLRAMKKDSEMRPEDIDDAENLLSAEDQAYSWALDRPSLIPYWMHWEKGLPNKGVKSTDPSYRPRQIKISPPKTPNRPTPDVLPEYLQNKQESINKIIKKRPMTRQDLDDIEDLMYSLEPEDLHAEHTSWNNLKARYNILRRLGLLTVEDDDNRLKASRQFRDKFYRKWLHEFMENPIQLMIAQDGVSRDAGKGLFYVSIQRPPPHLITTLKLSADRINKLLQDRDLSQRDQQELDRLLLPYLPDEIRHLDQLVKEEEAKRPQENERVDAVTKEHHKRLEHWMNRLRDVARFGGGLTLHLQGPGDPLNDSAEALSCPWPSRYFPNVPFDPGQIPRDLIWLQSDINDALMTYNGVASSEVDKQFVKEQLDDLLPNVMYPKLRKLAIEHKAQKSRGETALTPEQQLREGEYLSTYQDWIAGLGVQIRILIPPSDDFEEGPNVFYFRGHKSIFNIPDQSLKTDSAADRNLDPFTRERKAFKRWARKIREIRLKLDPNSGSPILEGAADAPRGELYEILADLQPPALMRWDILWREVSQSRIQGDREITPLYRDTWKQKFLRWAWNIQDSEVTVQRPPPGENPKYCPDDIGKVFYRGPLVADTQTQAHEQAVPTDSRPLPDEVKADQDLVQAILLRRLINMGGQLTGGDEEMLQCKLKQYWQPAQIFYKEAEDKVEPLVREARLTEFRRRSQCFIDQCTDGGFKIIRLPKRAYETDEDDTFIALDTTVNCPDQWKEKLAHRNTLPEDLNVKFEDLLHRLWFEDSAKFYKTILDMETEINTRLNKYNEISSRPDRQQFDILIERLIQLLRPFLPRRMETPETDTSTNPSDINTALSHFLEDLAEISQTGWIKIRCTDPLMDPNKRRNERGISRNIYFSPPPDMHRPAAPGQEMAVDSTPRGFKRIEEELNELIRTYRRGGYALPPDDMDRMRTLLRTIMPPDIAEEDEDLRDMDEQWREEQIAEPGQSRLDIEAEYISRSPALYEWIRRKIESLEGNLVTLVTKRPESSTPGVQELQIDNPSELPPDFRSREKPSSLISRQRDLNNYIGPRPDGTQLERDPYMDSSLEAIWERPRREYEEHYIKKLRKLNGITDGQPTPSKLLEEAIESANCEVVIAAMKQLRRAKAGEQHIRYYETYRGVVDWKWENGPAPTEDEESPALYLSLVAGDFSQSDLKTAEPIDIIVDSDRSSLADVRDEFFSLSNKVRSNTLTVDERAVVVRFMTPLPANEREVAETALMDAVGKLKGDSFLAEDAQQARKAFLTIMWQNFGERNPELRDGIIPTPLPLNTLLKKDLSRGPRSDTNWTYQELRQIALDINGMVASFQQGQLGPEDSRLLDYLLRPLTSGPLSELYDRVTRLGEEKSSLESQRQTNLDFSQATALAEYTRQYRDKFEQWKRTLVPGEIFIDDLYYGPEAVNRVVRRHRLWKGALETAGQPSPTATLPLSPLTPTTLLDSSDEVVQIYPILKDYISSPGPWNEVEKLHLEILPDHLRQIAAEVHSLIHSQAVAAQASVQYILLLQQMQRTFIRQFLQLYPQVIERPAVKGAAQAVDFTGKAERRGVQRAAVELGLNLLATNQEQHRPHDKFRKVKLPRKHQAPDEEVPLWQPLEPWYRPVELEPYKYTKVMRKYREWKDGDYHIARNRSINEHPGSLPAPENFSGPHTRGSDDDLEVIVRDRNGLLLAIQSQLLWATKEAPRPLTQRLNVLIDAALRSAASNVRLSSVTEEIWESPLSSKEFEALRTLALPSWYEGDLARAYPDQIPGIPADDPLGIPKLHEFERDIFKIWDSIPFWHGAFNEDTLIQKAYDPQANSVPVDGKGEQGLRLWPDPNELQLSTDAANESQGLLHRINSLRRAEAQQYGDVVPHQWTRDEAKIYITAMHNARRIHFEEGKALVARIPPNGHPENKWVTSRKDAQDSPHVRLNPVTNEYEVQYTQDGSKCTPIIQPNKHDYLMHAAVKLGRDIGRLSRILGNPETFFTDESKNKMRAQGQEAAWTHMNKLAAEKGLKPDNTGFTSLAVQHVPPSDAPDAKDISIRKMFRDLNKIAPDLAQEAGITVPADPKAIATEQSNKDAARVVQMQILEEMNNCWESRFPENEHVWAFAAHRVDPQFTTEQGRIIYGANKQFFNMRRWPLDGQSKETREKYTKGAKQVQEKEVVGGDPDDPDDPGENRTDLWKQRDEDIRKYGRWTGRGQPPMFTFGETPFQQAYLSYEIENHLADVEEFYPKPTPPNWFQRNIIPPLRDLALWSIGATNDDEDHLSSSSSSSSDDDDVNNPYRLPKVPKSWKPDSVSSVQKRWDVAEQILRSPGIDGFPKIEELYFSPAEIEWRRAREERERIAAAKVAAIRKMERWAGLEWMYLTNARRREAMLACDIDPVTEMERVAVAVPSGVQQGGVLPLRGEGTANAAAAGSPGLGRVTRPPMPTQTQPAPAAAAAADVMMSGAIQDPDPNGEAVVGQLNTPSPTPAPARSTRTRTPARSRSPPQTGTRRTRSRPPATESTARRPSTSSTGSGGLKRTSSRGAEGSPKKRKKVTISDEAIEEEREAGYELLEESEDTPGTGDV